MCYLGILSLRRLPSPVAAGVAAGHAERDVAGAANVVADNVPRMTTDVLGYGNVSGFAGDLERRRLLQRRPLHDDDGDDHLRLLLIAVKGRIRVSFDFRN